MGIKFGFKKDIFKQPKAGTHTAIKQPKEGYAPTQRAGQVKKCDIMASTPDALLLRIAGHTRSFWFPKKYIVYQVLEADHDMLTWIPNWLLEKVH
jgi:hypothetical protein